MIWPIFSRRTYMETCGISTARTSRAQQEFHARFTCILNPEHPVVRDMKHQK